jgi:hypothetical protein
MATNVVEQMLIELGFENSKFTPEAEKAIKKNKELEKSLTDTEKASKKTEKAQDELTKKQHNAIEQTAKFGEAIAKVTKELTGFFAIIIGSTGLFKLANDAARANMEVSKLSGQLGMNTRSITDWRNAAGAFGGSAEGMTASLTGIKQAMNGLVMFGDASMLPYFNALGVNVVDNAGKVRQLDDVMLDLADAFQKMPRDQAYTIGKKMGFDDGTINALVSGRKELQEILAIQKQMYHSDEKAIAQSKELTKQQAILNAHWQSMKQLVGDALTPILIGLVKVVNGFFEFLQRHEKVIKAVFRTAAIIIGMLLIPTLLSAARALLGFIAPFTPLIRVFGLLGAAISPVTLAITALGGAFVLLYDDYKTWAEGGDSLFDWSAFVNGIEKCKLFVESLSDAFGRLSEKASEAAVSMLAAATGEKKEDIAGFIGESAYRLTHGGKDYNEYNNINPAGDAPVQPRVPADKAKAAAEYATKHAGAKSKNGCGWAVNEAFRKQGIKASGHGKDVAKNLISTGQFQSIPYSKNYVPQIGDVMSIPAGYGQHAQYGHVAIWNGTRWVSDYTQQVLRGNTAATNDESYKNILSGKVTPVIARMKTTATAVPQPAKNKGNMNYAQQVYASLREHGFSAQQARIMTAEIGRENSFNPDLLFGSHTDPKNGAMNVGLISWQGSRAKKLLALLTSKGLYKNGKMARSKDSLDTMVEFMLSEISSNPAYSKTKNEFLNNPNVDYEKGHNVLGENYIGWSHKDPRYKNGHARRDAYFEQMANMEMAYNANRISKGVAQNQLASTGSVTHNDNRKQVNVNIPKMEVKTSSSTVSGNVVAAMKELQNYTFNQLGTSMT